MIKSAESLTIVPKGALRNRKIQLMKRERAKLDELKRGEIELETMILEELTATGERRALLDEPEKIEIGLMLSGGHQKRLRLESALDRFLIQCHICTDSTWRPPEEMSRAEGDDATLKPFLV